MLHLRRSALRILSSQPSSFVPKPRTITTFASSTLKVPRQSTSVKFQRRWATGEAEAKEEPPISQIQPTPQEEVENAVQSDNAAVTDDSAAVEVETEEQRQEGAVEAAAESVTETVSNAAETLKDTASGLFGRGQETARSDTSNGGGFDRRSAGPREGTNVPKPTIYIGNLFFDVTENDLVKELARFGTIKKVRLMRDARGLSKGFGYVDFETTEAATKAIETLNQQLFEGRRLAVQYAAFETKDMDGKFGGGRKPYSDRPMNPPSKTLFIGNMSFEMTDRDLNALFRGIRNVIDVRVAIDRRTGQPRGFAHADFVDVKSAMEALKVLADKETYGRKLRIDYSYGPSNAPRNQPPEQSGSGSMPQE